LRETLKHRAHLLRVAGVFAAGLVVFLLVRGILVPEGFGEYGHYRPGALKDIRALPNAFAPHAVCGECHTDTADALKKGKHAGVGCQACHGPLAQHVDDQEKQKPDKLDPRKLCVTCHAANVAKPAKFPQIDPATHGDGAPCTSCHQPHDPMGGSSK
jgi:cytochrome c7-like protein